MFHWDAPVIAIALSVLFSTKNVLCARSTPPCDFELCCSEFLVLMLPSLIAIVMIKAVRKSSWSECSMVWVALPHSTRKCCSCVTA